jgi:surface protein
MFNYCEKLESADYSYLDLQNITDMHYLVSASPFLKISISLILKLKN